jgi:hypothetical protein
VSAIRDLLTDPAVAISVVAAIALVAAAVVVEIKVPALLVALAPVVLAAQITRVDVEHYVSLPVPWYQWWTGPAIALALGAFGLAARSVPATVAGRSALTVFTAAVAAGVFLCVPETMLLRLVPGPMAVVAVGVVAGWIRPFGVAGALVLAAMLGWIAIVDGQIRGSAIVGAGACLVAASLLPLALGPAAGRRAPVPGGGPAWGWLPRLGVPVLAVVLCARLAGTLGSTAAAVVTAALVIGAAAGVLWWWPAAIRPAESSL